MFQTKGFIYLKLLLTLAVCGTGDWQKESWLVHILTVLVMTKGIIKPFESFWSSAEKQIVNSNVLISLFLP